MNKEWLMIGAMGTGGILFAIGGTGFKWARRFVLPAVFGVLAALSGAVLWKCAIMTALFIGAFHLGYGVKSGWLKRSVAAVAFVIPTFLFGFTPWQIVTPLAFLGMYKLSNTVWAANMFLWKCVEFLTGSLIGVTIASLIGR